MDTFVISSCLWLPLGHIPKCLPLALELISKCLIPIDLKCASCLGYGRVFVKGPEIFKSICILHIMILPRLTNSRMRWNFHSTCLFFWWFIVSLAYTIAPFLSQCRLNGLGAFGNTPSSITNLLIQTPSFTNSEVVMYLASIVELIIVAFLELFQLTTPPFIVDTKPDWDCESSMSVWKHASV